MGIRQMIWVGLALMTLVGPRPVEAADAKVVKAFPVNWQGEPRHIPGPIEVGDILAVEVKGFAAFVGADEARCSKVRLYLNRQKVKALSPQRCVADDETVRFVLESIDRRTDAAWQALLVNRAGLMGLKTPVDVTLGIDDTVLPTAVDGDNAVDLLLANAAYAAAASIGFLVALFLLIGLCIKTDLVRRPGPEPYHQRAFSLSRVQLAWWFILVLGAFLFVTVFSGGVAVIPASVLGLLGVSVGTHTSARVVEKKATPTDRPTGGGTDTPFLDMLKDGDGYSLSRFQAAIWTLAIGAVFVWEVIEKLTVPELDGSLVALMGLSSGTYVGMKTQEAPPAKPPVEPTDTPAQNG